ncbi:MAG: hypothetical protein Q3M24_01470 [Candidatus Electrothrix aestuarii]|uniref:Uncharacterized protein n=1 Tax=Candidatus Electrothrix aestuarii TaxID=3062594 RepID=A0AAU8LVY4_9BACT|nr:hypothetical protein [Candidatus Electrothrix aestuarii]
MLSAGILTGRSGTGMSNRVTHRLTASTITDIARSTSVTSWQCSIVTNGPPPRFPR